MVLAHVALVRRLVEVLAVLQGGTHAYGVKMFNRLEEERVAEDFFLFCDFYLLWIKKGSNLGVLDGRGVQRKILDWELPSVHRHRAVERRFKVRSGKERPTWNGG